MPARERAEASDTAAGPRAGADREGAPRAAGHPERAVCKRADAPPGHLRAGLPHPPQSGARCTLKSCKYSVTLTLTHAISEMHGCWLALLCHAWFGGSAQHLRLLTDHGNGSGGHAS